MRAEDLINKITLADCMDIMPLIPEMGRDVLAIVDPPYGIGAGTMTMGKGVHSFSKDKKWDNEIPNQKYFNELFKVSNNQIIWGGNYFSKYLEPSPHWIVWDKRNPNLSFAEGELAWIRDGKNLRIFNYFVGYLKTREGGKIHPTQKPIPLYRWLLQNYAKPGQLILDTHSGSGSLACACHLEKYDFIAIEKDPDYHRDSMKRLDELRSQGRLF